MTSPKRSTTSSANVIFVQSSHCHLSSKYFSISFTSTSLVRYSVHFRVLTITGLPSCPWCQRCISSSSKTYEFIEILPALAHASIHSNILARTELPPTKYCTPPCPTFVLCSTRASQKSDRIHERIFQVHQQKMTIRVLFLSKVWHCLD